MNASPYGPPVNTDIDYCQTLIVRLFFSNVMLCFLFIYFLRISLLKFLEYLQRLKKALSEHFKWK